MASKIEVRVGKKGTSYRAKVRRRGVNTSRTFSSLADAKKWVITTEVNVFKDAPVDTGKVRPVTLGAIFDQYIREVKP